MSETQYGVEIPNRIFVGGIAFNTTELELKNFFQTFGIVKDTKIITDRSGVSKGYGFITFDNQEDATRVQEQVSNADICLSHGASIRGRLCYEVHGNLPEMPLLTREYIKQRGVTDVNWLTSHRWSFKFQSILLVAYSHDSCCLLHTGLRVLQGEKAEHRASYPQTARWPIS
jgi:RNA recognition motif-containing protein